MRCRKNRTEEVGEVVVLQHCIPQVQCNQVEEETDLKAKKAPFHIVNMVLDYIQCQICDGYVIVQWKD